MTCGGPSCKGLREEGLETPVPLPAEDSLFWKGRPSGKRLVPPLIFTGPFTGWSGITRRVIDSTPGCTMVGCPFGE